MGMAKPSNYKPGGSGRDTYIIRNNGGLYHEFTPASAMTPANFRNCQMRQSFNLCGLDVKMPNYHADGSGRDSYIVMSNGGFKPEKLAAEFDHTFVHSLRRYKLPSTPSEYSRPKTTKGAQRMSKAYSKSIRDSQTNPYLRS